MRAKAWAGCAALVAFGLVGAAPADAAGKLPGVLHATDIPGKFILGGPPIQFVSLKVERVDPAACTQTAQPDSGGGAAVDVHFARINNAPGATTVSEIVTSYGNASAAKASFANRNANLKAAAQCPSVGFVPPGKTVATGGTVVRRQKFPAIGDASFTERLASQSGSEPSFTVTFRSGVDIAEVNISGGLTKASIIASSLRDLATTAKRAKERLAHSFSIAPPAPARSLVVDPATNGCAQAGLKSPGSPNKVTITFVNKTDQTLNVTWIDYAGADSNYGTVAPKGTTVQQTFAGHIWKLTDQTGQCVRIATASGPRTTVTVTG